MHAGAITVRLERSPTASAAWSGPTTRRPTRVRSPTAATATTSSLRSTTSTHCLRSSILPGLPPCCARALPRGRRCATGGVTKGKRVAIVGLGGLGHMGLKFAHALGAETALFTTSVRAKQPMPRGLARMRWSSQPTRMRWQSTPGKFDFILDCVSAPHDAQRVSEAASVGWHPLSGRPSQRSASRRCLLPGHKPSLPVRVHDRRYAGDSGDARLLRGAQHRL